ncbi:S8 family serine peptidase [Streptomyces sp. NPDC048507]|uniref:S8 family serine peptidase n=1 Tax=Streptomyces sp. NPDC048507 TaxID=3365560 RepID=UPI00372268BA
MTAMTALLPAAALLAASTVLPPHSAVAAADVPTAPYVVVLKDTTARAAARALASEAARAGDRVGAVYEAALSGFAVRTTAARAVELAADPRVASVEPDTVYRLSDPPEPAPAAAPVPAPVAAPAPNPAAPTPAAPPAAAPAPAAPSAAPTPAPQPVTAPTPNPVTAPAPSTAPVPATQPVTVPAPNPVTAPTPATQPVTAPAPAAVLQTAAPWPLDRIDQRELPLDGGYTYATRAQGVTVYVVDTGINTLHQEFGGRARSGYNAVWTEGAADCNGHGTHVAATVGGATYGVAKGVSLVGVKVADCQGDGRLSAILRGLDWMVKDAVRTAAKGGPVVANMSMGGSRSRAMDAAVNRAVASGITFAVAAGNTGKDACGGSPSGVPAALTVGATDATDRRPAFSSHGRCVDISAPGVSVTSAWKGSATATARATGTSMAAPHVAGVAALILAGGTARTPEQVRQALVRSAVSDRITGLPAGTANLLLHVPTDR